MFTVWAAYALWLWHSHQKCKRVHPEVLRVQHLLGDHRHSVSRSSRASSSCLAGTKTVHFPGALVPGCPHPLSDSVSLTVQIAAQGTVWYSVILHIHCSPSAFTPPVPLPISPPQVYLTFPFASHTTGPLSLFFADEPSNVPWPCLLSYMLFPSEVSDSLFVICLIPL